MDRVIDPGFVGAPFDLGAYHAAQRDKEVATRPLPGRGVFFEHHIDLREPEGGKLTDRLVECFDTARNKQRLRDRETWRLRLRKLAANAIRGYFFRQPSAVLYSRGSATDWYQDKPACMRHGVLADVIDPLIKAGLLDGITGKKMPYGYKSWASSYWATEELILKASECGITEHSIVPDVPEDDLVQLYAPKPRLEFDQIKGVLVRPPQGQTDLVCSDRRDPAVSRNPVRNQCLLSKTGNRSRSDPE